MSLIKVTAKTRNGKAFAKEVLIDLDRVTEPLFEQSTDTVIYVSEGNDYHNIRSQNATIVEYVVDERVTDIAFLAPSEVFQGSVVTRDGRKPVNTKLGFIYSNFSGVAVPEGAGSKFLYQEQGGYDSVEYIITQDITAIQPASTVAPALELGNSLFVSSKGTTVALGAVRESLTNHFSDLNEAITAAQGGDTIYTYGGTHDMTVNLTKEDVKHVFSGRPTINNAFITDGGVASVIDIKGDANLTKASTTGVIEITNADTVAFIECQKILGNYSWAVLLSGGKDSTLIVHESISSTQVNYCISIRVNANWTVNVDKIKNNGAASGGAAAIQVKNTFIGNTTVNVREIEIGATNLTTNNVIQMDNGTSTSSLLTVNLSGKIINPAVYLDLSNAAILMFGGRLIFNGNINGGANHAVSFANSVSKFQHNGSASNDGTAELISVRNGSEVELNGKYLSSNPKVIDLSSTGKLTVNGTITNEHVAAVNRYGIFLTAANTLIMDVLKIIFTNKTGICYSIDAAAPTTVVVTNGVASNSGDGANITNGVTGTSIIQDDNVQ